MSGKKIWDVLYRKDTNIKVHKDQVIEAQDYDKLEQIVKDFAYNSFLELKTKYETKIEDFYRKYRYAVEIRQESAMKIGIENIRLSKLKALEDELKTIKNNYEKQKNFVPILKPVFMAELLK